MRVVDPVASAEMSQARKVGDRVGAEIMGVDLVRRLAGGGWM